MTTPCTACGRPLDATYSLPAQPPFTGRVCVDKQGCFRHYLAQPVPVAVPLRALLAERVAA